jgi:hypothetical protein
MYKFLREVNGKIVSEYGTQEWKVGKKYSVKGKIECCRNGYHASDTPLDALNYVNGEVLAICEGSGDCDTQSDKSAHRTMKIVKAYRWRKLDSVALAIFCAEKVIHIFETRYPDDKYPRNAIVAAEAWLQNPTDDNAIAANDAARAAEARAARAAARAAAYAAARAADAAAYAAADAAYAAAYAAADAADYATDYADMKDKINAWMIERIAELEEIR